MLLRFSLSSFDLVGAWERCYIYQWRSSATLLLSEHCYIYHCWSNATISTNIGVGAMLRLSVWGKCYNNYYIISLKYIVDVVYFRMGIIISTSHLLFVQQLVKKDMKAAGHGDFFSFPLQSCPIALMSLKMKADKQYHHNETRV